MTALLRTDLRGTIREANPAAERLLGACVTQPCARAVDALDAGGSSICAGRCADEDFERDVRQALIRGKPARLVCGRLGDGLVVAILPEPAPEDGVALTPRERRVLALVASGKTSRHIAGELGIRPRTVRTHVEHVLRKLGVHTRAEAVARAFGSGTLGAPN